MSASGWAGGDFHQPTRNDGGVALCSSACMKTQLCRLGLTKERLEADGTASFEITCPAGLEGGPGVAHGGWTAGVWG
jgi:hypothetical protein